MATTRLVELRLTPSTHPSVQRSTTAQGIDAPGVRVATQRAWARCFARKRVMRSRIPHHAIISMHARSLTPPDPIRRGATFVRTEPPPVITSRG